MATFRVTSPDGTEYEINAPEGATQEDAIAYIKNKVGASTPQQSEPQRARSVPESLGRQLGLTARAGLKGITALPAMIGDALGAKSTQSVDNLANMIGLPQPETGVERFSQGVGEAMAGGGGMVSLGRNMMTAAPQAAKNIGTMLSANPSQQLALSGVSGGATEMARDSGAGPIGQVSAAIAAPLAAGSLYPAIKGVVSLPYNLIAPQFSKSAAETGAARMANAVAGDRAGAVANSFRQALPEQTAGQAAFDTGSAETMAMQKILRDRRPSEYAAIDKAQKYDWKRSWKDLNQSTEAIRSKALDDANYGGVKSDAIIGSIDSVLATPGKGRSSRVVEGALNAVKERISKFTDPDFGMIDAKDLYDIRKKIGTTISTYSKENADWDKALASGLERDIQRAIDVEIVGAGGGKNWMTYLSEYSKEAKRLMEIKEAAKRAKELATQGGSEARFLMGKSENPIHGVNLLNRAAMLANAVIKRSEMAGGRRLEQAAADLMMPQSVGGNPSRFGMLMQEQATVPTTWEEILRNARLSPQAATMGLLQY